MTRSVYYFFAVRVGFPLFLLWKAYPELGTYGTAIVGLILARNLTKDFFEFMAALRKQANTKAVNAQHNVAKP